MTPLIDAIFDELAAYRDRYRDGGLDVPEHEIVMASSDFAALMDTPIAHEYTHCFYPERNFGGAAIVIEGSDAGAIAVRDRTMDKHGDR